MNSPKPAIRLRFAPSPTGELHLGGARTALYNWLFARQQNGGLILRIEDTDQSRYVAGSMERFFQDLAWLGINFDEGPNEGGEFGPYIQSQRVKRHREIAHHLIKSGAAYFCHCSEERLRHLREQQQKNGQAPHYDRYCRDNQESIINDQESKSVIRLKVPLQGKLVFDDLIRGKVEFDLSNVDDQILLKSDGYPTYHLANVVDDHDMKISHVVRAEEWLPSTPKHLLIYQALGWSIPVFSHLPLILARDRKKLSKRIHGAAVWISNYRQQGYLPEALINYLALLGWNPGGNQEFFTIKELTALFDWAKVHKAGAIFDVQKLDAFQGHYVRQLSLEEFVEKVKAYIEEKDIKEKLITRIAEVMQSRIIRLSDIKSAVDYFDKIPKYQTGLLIFDKSNHSQTVLGLKQVLDNLKAAPSSWWNHINQLNQLLLQTVIENQLSNGDIFWPVRVALTGQKFSPPPAECLWILGHNESINRIELAIDKLNNFNSLT